MKLKNVWNKIIGKKEKVPVYRWDYGLSQFNELESKGLIEGGHITVNHFSVAKNHLWRAWSRGYQKFSVTYVPNPGTVPNYNRFNDELEHLDNNGAKYEMTHTKDGSITLTVNRKREAN